jgi:opacity protein-like surface antigen
MKTWILAVALFAGSTTLFGQAAEFTLNGGLSHIGNSDLGSGYSLDNGFRLDFRVTLNTQRFFGHEFGYAYNRTHLLLAGLDQGGMAIHQGYYNFLVYAVPEGKAKIRPFADGGVHFDNFVPPGSSAQYGGGSNKFGFNYGAGVKVRFGDKWITRVDVKQFITGKPFDLPGASGLLRQTTFTVGFGIGI